MWFMRCKHFKFYNLLNNLFCMFNKINYKIKELMTKFKNDFLKKSYFIKLITD